MMNLRNQALKPSLLGLLAVSFALIAIVTFRHADRDSPPNPAARGVPEGRESGITPGPAGSTTDESRPPLASKSGVRGDDGAPPDVLKGLSDLGWTLQADRIGRRSAEGGVKLTQLSDGMEFRLNEISATPAGGFVAVGPVWMRMSDGKTMTIKSEANGEVFRVMPDGSWRISICEGSGYHVVEDESADS